MDVESLKAKRCYRGVRHIHSYKVRGQRTRSRGANVRGRVGSTVGVVKKKIMPQKAEKE
jgi:ribosomal protein S13